MKTHDFTKKLGISPGVTLAALAELAEKVSPTAPWDAFAPLWLRLPWLRPEVWTLAETRRVKNVCPFASTGGDSNHFGFLMDDNLATDERPIVYVLPQDDEECTEIVAPNIREFLGLLTIGFGEVVSRDLTDGEWATARGEWFGDDAARLAEMDRLSELLLSIPGVVRPASPRSVTNAHPNQSFTFELPDQSSDDETRRLERQIDILREQMLSLGAGMIEGRVVDALTLARAKNETTSSLLEVLDELASLDQEAAARSVSWWRSSALWNTLAKGVSGNLEAFVARYTKVGH